MQCFFIDENKTIKVNSEFEPYFRELMDEMLQFAKTVRFFDNVRYHDKDKKAFAVLRLLNGEYHALIFLPPRKINNWDNFAVVVHEVGHIINKHPQLTLTDAEHIQCELEANSYVVKMFNSWIEQSKDRNVCDELKTISKAYQYRIDEAWNKRPSRS